MHSIEDSGEEGLALIHSGDVGQGLVLGDVGTSSIRKASHVSSVVVEAVGGASGGVGSILKEGGRIADTEEIER